MIRTTLDLPAGYSETGRIRLDEDRRLRRRLNVSSLLILLLFLAAGNLFMPIFTLGLDSAGNIAGPGLLWMKLLSMVLIFLLHSLLLEWIKGPVMKKVGGAAPFFAFRSGGAYTGSPAYFSKKDYRPVVILPVILVAVLFLLVTMILPLDWFWVGYAAQAINLAGGVSKYYIAFQAVRHPPEVLILDSGPQVIFYEPAEEPARKTARKGPAQAGQNRKGDPPPRHRGKKK